MTAAKRKEEGQIGFSHDRMMMVMAGRWPYSFLERGRKTFLSIPPPPPHFMKAIKATEREERRREAGALEKEEEEETRSGMAFWTARSWKKCA